MHLSRQLAATVLALTMTTPAVFAAETQGETHRSLVDFNELFNAYAASHDIEGLVSLYDQDAYWIAPMPCRQRAGTGCHARPSPS